LDEIFCFGVPMSFRRVGGLAAIALAMILWMSCGQVYRPVVLPVNPTPPSPANFHAVFGISNNVPFNPGATLQIDVSGDTDIGIANMGVNPTHAAALPNNSRVFVASAGSLDAGDSDVVTAFIPAGDSQVATGLGTPTTFTYPGTSAGPSSNITAISEAGSVVTMTLSAALPTALVGSIINVSGVAVAGYDGSFPITSVTGTTIQYSNSVTGLAASSGGSAALPSFCSYLPDFVATTQSTAVFVANYGVEGGSNCSLASTDSVSSLSVATSSMTNVAYLTPGAHPVALTETPNGQNLYVVNQGNNSVVNLSPADLSTIATIPVGNTPVWAVARSDNQRIYVLTQGDGTLTPIDVPSNTVLASQTNLSVGAGANFILYDSNLNRLYVTNPVTSTVYVYSTTGGVDASGTANDTPLLLSTIVMTAGSNPPCPEGCAPVSVAALPDGTRFYVASYASEATCSDPNVGPSAPCIIPMLTVFDALSMTVKTPPSSLLLPTPSLSLLSTPQFTGTQYAVTPATSCVPAATYAPGSTRFRMFATAATDSSHVYVSICDAGTIADINAATSTLSTGGSNAADTLITDIVAPFGGCPATSCSSVATITSFSITSNVVIFQAINNFIPGVKVSISGLSSSAGAQLDGQTVTVIATGLSGTQFEAVVSQANVGSTADVGTAVPLSPPQTPIFLLPGQ
jgi:YVTN family beta-propeller protein